MNCTGPEFQELSKDLLAEGKTVRFQVQGGSMYPFVRGEEAVTIKSAPPSEIRYADIILYRDISGRTILHRVLKIRKVNESLQFFTKGDALSEADGYIDGAAVIGIVSAIGKFGAALWIDNGFWRYINILYAACLPFSRWALSLAARVIRLFVKTGSSIQGYEPLVSLLNGENLSSNLNDSTWRSLLDKSKKEYIFYPAYRKLIESGQIKSMPESIRQKYEAAYNQHLGESATRAHLIEQVLSRLDSLNIRMLLVKGPALDSMIYDGFFRPRVDLDIVIDGNIPDAGRGLANFGYFSREGEGRLGAAHANSRIFKNASIDLIPLHIHSHLINNTFLTSDGLVEIEMSDVWGQTEVYKDCRNIVMLKPEMNILYLCDHGLKHDFDKLIYLYEIEKLIAYYGNRMDWNKFTELARKFRMERGAYYGLYFAKEILNGNIPDAVIGSVKPNRFSHGEKIFIKDTLNGKRRRYSSFFVYIAARPGFLRKLNFIFRMIFPVN